MTNGQVLERVRCALQERVKKHRFFKISLYGVLCALFLFGGIAFDASVSFAADYSDKSSAGTDVSISKEAAWTGVNGEAEVKLTFNGLEKVHYRRNSVDLLFVLDTSGSMGTQGKCVDPKHTTYSLNNTPNTTGKEAELNALITDAITQGKIQIEGGGDGSTFGERVHMDVDLKIPIPAALLGRENLYFVPLLSDFTTSNTSRLYFGHVNTPIRATLGVLDESAPVSPVSLTGLAYYLQYHCDENKNRIAYEGSVDGIDYQYIGFLDCSVGYNQYRGKDGKDLMYDENGIPTAWKEEHGCYLRSHLLYDSVLSMSQEILSENADNRVAFAAFNTNARGKDTGQEPIESQGYSDFVGNYSTFEERLSQVIPYTNQQKEVTVSALNGTTTAVSSNTNYTAGLLSANKILEEDPGKDNGNKKIVIFFSDGMPNYVQTPFTLTDDGGTYLARRYNLTGNYEPITQAKKVVDNIINNNEGLIIHGVTLVDADNLNVNEKVGALTNGDIHSIDARNPDNMEASFAAIFESLNETFGKKTKLVTVADLIDNRYFTVDEPRLSANLSNQYFPQYARYSLRTVLKEGVSCQEVVFTYEVDADAASVESVTIPLIKRPEGVIQGTEGHVPTNYDPTGTKGGAKAEYKDISGINQSIETKQTWLPTGELLVEKLDAKTNRHLIGAEFNLYFANNNTRYGALTYVSDSDGKIALTTLPPGTYYLVETTAPEGYMLPLVNRHVFEISFDSVGSNYASLQIENTKKETVGEDPSDPKEDPSDPNEDPSNPKEDPLTPVDLPTPASSLVPVVGDEVGCMQGAFLSMVSVLCLVLVGKSFYENRKHSRDKETGV